MILTTVVAVGASVFGSATVLLFRRRRSMPGKKVRVGAQLDVRDHNMLRIWADKNGLTIPDYVRKVLLASIPQQEKHRMNGTDKKTVVDAAFEVAEQQDKHDLGTNTGNGAIIGLPPSRQPQRGVVSEAERTHPMQRVTKVAPTPLPTVPPGPHPCVHLMTMVVPANMKGQCQGTCNQNTQHGRICFWTPTTARNCPVFEPKRAMQGPPTSA